MSPVSGSVTDALTRKTAYTYDAKGNMLTVTKLATTANAVTTTFTNEPAFNQVATVTDPLTHTTMFAFDAIGSLRLLADHLDVHAAKVSHCLKQAEQAEV
jgi:YD repeat-containing protein